MREWIVPHLQLPPTTLQDQAGHGAPEINHAAMPKVLPHPAACDQVLSTPRSLKAARNQAASLNSPMRRRTPPHEDENTEADKGEVEVSSDGQAASNGEEGQEHPQIQDTLTGISQVFGTHEDTDSESDPREKIQSVRWKQCQPSPKEGMPPKDLSGSSSEEEQPTNEALHDKARQRAQQLDPNFNAWWHKKIAKGIRGWATRDTMICDLPEHGKMQPNHPDPVGPPLDYMGECQVFNSIQSDIYDLCRFYILGMTGDPPEFPAPWEPATRRKIRDLLKSAHAIGQPYMILAHSADLVTAISMLRELHTAACL